MKQLKISALLSAALFAGYAFAETYLPGEGNFEVSVWQTTGKRPFREIPTTPFTSHAYTNRPPIAVDRAEVRGRYSWLGVSLTDASAWVLSRLPPEKRRALIEAVFTPKGANLGGVRLNIGSSDYSTAIYCYDDTPGDVEMKHFSLARDDNWLVPMAKEILAVNPGTFFFAAPWSPPGWMKTNGNFIDGHFKDGMEQAMANYLAAYVREMERRGIEVGAVTVQNEAALSTRGTYPSCVFREEQESAVVKLLAKKLKADGLKTKVWLWDWDARWDWIANKPLDNDRLVRQLSDPEVRTSVDAIAWHSYTPLAAAEEIWKIKKEFPDVRFYHTERGPASHVSNRTQKWWIRQMASMFENGCESFTSWNLCLTDDGQPLTGPHLCMGLVTVDLETGDFTPSAQFDVFRHIGPFVKPGAEVLRFPVRRFDTATAKSSFSPDKAEKDAADEGADLDDCMALLFRNPGDEYVLVVASDGRGHQGRQKADASEPRPKIYVSCGGEMKHLPLPYGTWSLTTMVFRKR